MKKVLPPSSSFLSFFSDSLTVAVVSRFAYLSRSQLPVGSSPIQTEEEEEVPLELLLLHLHTGRLRSSTTSTTIPLLAFTGCC